MIEKRASLLSRVVPDAETAYRKAINNALKQVYLRLDKLQMGYTANSPDNTWTRARLTSMIAELTKSLNKATKNFQPSLFDESIGIIQIDNAGAVSDFDKIINIGHEDDEVTPYGFKVLSKKQIQNLFKTDYITFTYLGATGVKKYSSISIQSMLDASMLNAIEEVRSILTAGAINGQSPAIVTSQLKPVSQKAYNTIRLGVRTLLFDASNLADIETLESNRQFFEYYQFIAVIDDRTSRICRSIDGRRWKEVPEVFKPPLHPNCRSKLTPIPKNFKAGTRPLVLPDGTIKIVDGDLSYRDIVEIYPALDNKSLIDVEQYQRLMEV